MSGRSTDNSGRRIRVLGRRVHTRGNDASGSRQTRRDHSRRCAQDYFARGSDSKSRLRSFCVPTRSFDRHDARNPRGTSIGAKTSGPFANVPTSNAGSPAENSRSNGANCLPGKMSASRRCCRWPKFRPIRIIARAGHSSSATAWYSRHRRRAFHEHRERSSAARPAVGKAAPPHLPNGGLMPRPLPPFAPAAR